ncbi:CPBP family intramembrane metalloprotease [Alkaliphilus pronyensis]|uniref:CPBP family intramembrane metalloprotease n=1 Tax=Alkaliphilus pronyensis TaxID=1482732 RepID=A0A6I0FF68_9FIRM|nr:CPBP family intramembrane glutamic endopeptidase [Alkaliphilus pronyensis]KAB3537847.1 CPBP family intramembrane metalloprotease [Alkaliphilus pronyensis]
MLLIQIFILAMFITIAVYNLIKIILTKEPIISLKKQIIILLLTETLIIVFVWIIGIVDIWFYTVILPVVTVLFTIIVLLFNYLAKKTKSNNSMKSISLFTIFAIITTRFFANNTFYDNMSTDFFIFHLFAIIHNVLIINVVLAFLLNSGFTKDDLGINIKSNTNTKNLHKYALCFFIGLGIMIGDIVAISNIYNLNILEYIKNKPAGVLFFDFIFNFFKNGIPEELLFRGLIFFLFSKFFVKKLGEERGVFLSVLTTNIIFTIIHTNVPISYSFNILFLGIILNYIRIKSGNIFIPAILHAMFNAFTPS